MQYPANGFRRIPLLRTPVNKGSLPMRPKRTMLDSRVACARTRIYDARYKKRAGRGREVRSLQMGAWRSGRSQQRNRLPSCHNLTSVRRGLRTNGHAGIDLEYASVFLRYGAKLAPSRPRMGAVSKACIQKVKRWKATVVESPVD